MKLNLEYLDFEEIHIGTMNQIISNIETVDEMFFCDIPVYELADFFDNDIAYDLFNDVCAGSYTPQIIENIETELNFTDTGWQIFADFIYCVETNFDSCKSKKYFESLENRNKFFQFIYTLYSERTGKTELGNSNVLKILDLLDEAIAAVDYRNLDVRNISKFTLKINVNTDDERKELILNLDIIFPDELKSDLIENRYEPHLQKIWDYLQK